MELQQNYDAIRAMDTEVIAIAQEERDPSTLSHTQRFVKNAYPLVADPNDEALCKRIFNAAKKTDHTLTDGEVRAICRAG